MTRNDLILLAEIDKGRFANSIKRGAEKGQREMPTMRAKIDERSVSRPLGRITGKASEFNKSMEASNARVVAFGASTGMVYGVQRAFRELVSTTIEVEATLADINSILNRSSDGLKSFSNELFNVARATGQSFQTAAQAAQELARQGLSAEETLTRVNDALILTRLSGIQAATAVGHLTAIINSFQSEVLTTTEIVNRLANVETNFAISSGDLANAIGRVGSTAQDAGVSLNELMAIVTTAQQLTARGGSVIGNSFKTIFTRVQRSSTLDALRDIGVETNNLDGSLRNTVDILGDLARQFDHLDQEQQAYIAELVGGVFQINVLKATLGDLNREYSIYGNALRIANDTTDEAIRRNERLNQTIKAKLNVTLANSVELAEKLGNIAVSDNLGGIIDKFNRFTEFVNETLDGEDAGDKFAQGIVKGMGNVLFGPVLAGFGLVLVRLFAKTSGFISKAFMDVSGLNSQSEKQRQIQQSISDTLKMNNTTYGEILARTRSKVAAEREILRLVRERVALEKSTPFQYASIARSAAFRSTRTSQLVPPTAAEGLMPSMQKEKRDVMRRVGGARPSAQPVPIPNFSLGQGKKGTVVVNTDEYLVNNFMGGDGTAVFNRDMIRSVGGVKKLSSFGDVKKITAAGGIVPENMMDFVRSQNDPREILRGLRGFAKNKGSSRLFIPMNDGKGLKVAMNMAGIAQNEKEFSVLSDWYAKENYGDILPNIFDYDENQALWGVVERFDKKMNSKAFKKFFGMPMYQANFDHYSPSNKNSTELFHKVRNFLGEFGLMGNDIRSGNLRIGPRPADQLALPFGQQTQDGPKLIDIGLDRSTFNQFYAGRGGRNLGRFAGGFAPQANILDLIRRQKDPKEMLKIARGSQDISAGSSRLFIPMDNERGLKVATSEAGVAQNQLEFDILSNKKARENYGEFLPNIFDYDKSDGMWGVVERAIRSPSPSDLLKHLGVSDPYYFSQTYTGPAPSGTTNTFDRIKKFLGEYGLMGSDMRVGNIMIGKHPDGVNEALKLIDLGLNQNVWDKFYKTGQRGSFNQGDSVWNLSQSNSTFARGRIPPKAGKMIGQGAFRNVYELSGDSSKVLNRPKTEEEVLSYLSSTFLPNTNIPMASMMGKDQILASIQKDRSDRILKVQKPLSESGLGPQLFDAFGDSSFIAERILHPTLAQVMATSKNPRALRIGATDSLLPQLQKLTGRKDFNFDLNDNNVYMRGQDDYGLFEFAGGRIPLDIKRKVLRKIKEDENLGLTRDSKKGNQFSAGSSIWGQRPMINITKGASFETLLHEHGHYQDHMTNGFSQMRNRDSILNEAIANKNAQEFLNSVGADNNTIQEYRKSMRPAFNTYKLSRLARYMSGRDPIIHEVFQEASGKMPTKKVASDVHLAYKDAVKNIRALDPDSFKQIMRQARNIPELRHNYASGFIPNFAGLNRNVAQMKMMEDALGVPMSEISKKMSSDPNMQAAFNAFAKGFGRTDNDPRQAYLPLEFGNNRNPKRLQDFLAFAKSRGLTGASGLIPNFASPVQNAVNREFNALKERGIPAYAAKNSIFVDHDPRVGVGVGNLFDEPSGRISQGVSREVRAGRNPRTSGMVPNFAVDLGQFTDDELNQVWREMEQAGLIKSNPRASVRQQLSREINLRNNPHVISKLTRMANVKSALTNQDLTDRASERVRQSPQGLEMLKDQYRRQETNDFRNAAVGDQYVPQIQEIVGGMPQSDEVNRLRHESKEANKEVTKANRDARNFVKNIPQQSEDFFKEKGVFNIADNYDLDQLELKAHDSYLKTLGTDNPLERIKATVDHSDFMNKNKASFDPDLLKQHVVDLNDQISIGMEDLFNESFKNGAKSFKEAKEMVRSKLNTQFAPEQVEAFMEAATLNPSSLDKEGKMWKQANARKTPKQIKAAQTANANAKRAAALKEARVFVDQETAGRNDLTDKDRERMAARVVYQSEKERKERVLAKKAARADAIRQKEDAIAQRKMQKRQMFSNSMIGASMGMSMLSGFIPSNNPAGGALQGAGIGAMMGSFAGPWGAGLGTVIGASIGGLKAKFDELGPSLDEAQKKFETLNAKVQDNINASTGVIRGFSDLNQKLNDPNASASDIRRLKMQMVNQFSNINDAGLRRDMFAQMGDASGMQEVAAKYQLEQQQKLQRESLTPSFLEMGDKHGRFGISRAAMTSGGTFGGLANFFGGSGKTIKNEEVERLSRELSRAFDFTDLTDAGAQKVNKLRSSVSGLSHSSKDQDFNEVFEMMGASPDVIKNLTSTGEKLMFIRTALDFGEQAREAAKLAESHHEAATALSDYRKEILNFNSTLFSLGRVSHNQSRREIESGLSNTELRLGAGIAEDGRFHNFTSSQMQDRQAQLNLTKLMADQGDKKHELTTGFRDGITGMLGDSFTQTGLSEISELLRGGKLIEALDLISSDLSKDEEDRRLIAGSTEKVEEEIRKLIEVNREKFDDLNNTQKEELKQLHIQNSIQKTIARREDDQKFLGGMNSFEAREQLLSGTGDISKFFDRISSLPKLSQDITDINNLGRVTEKDLIGPGEGGRIAEKNLFAQRERELDKQLSTLPSIIPDTISKFMSQPERGSTFGEDNRWIDARNAIESRFEQFNRGMSPSGQGKITFDDVLDSRKRQRDLEVEKAQGVIALSNMYGVSTDGLPEPMRKARVKAEETALRDINNKLFEDLLSKSGADESLIKMFKLDGKINPILDIIKGEQGGKLLDVDRENFLGTANQLAEIENSIPRMAENRSQDIHTKIGEAVKKQLGGGKTLADIQEDIKSLFGPTDSTFQTSLEHLSSSKNIEQELSFIKSMIGARAEVEGAAREELEVNKQIETLTAEIESAKENRKTTLMESEFATKSNPFASTISGFHAGIGGGVTASYSPEAMETFKNALNAEGLNYDNLSKDNKNSLPLILQEMGAIMASSKTVGDAMEHKDTDKLQSYFNDLGATPTQGKNVLFNLFSSQAKGIDNSSFDQQITERQNRITALRTGVDPQTGKKIEDPNLAMVEERRVAAEDQLDKARKARPSDITALGFAAPTETLINNSRFEKTFENIQKQRAEGKYVTRKDVEFDPLKELRGETKVERFKDAQKRTGLHGIFQSMMGRGQEDLVMRYIKHSGNNGIELDDRLTNVLDRPEGERQTALRQALSEINKEEQISQELATAKEILEATKASNEKQDRLIALYEEYLQGDLEVKHEVIQKIEVAIQGSGLSPEEQSRLTKVIADEMGLQTQIKRIDRLENNERTNRGQNPRNV